MAIATESTYAGTQASNSLSIMPLIQKSNQKATKNFLAILTANLSNDFTLPSQLVIDFAPKRCHLERPIKRHR